MKIIVQFMQFQLNIEYQLMGKIIKPPGIIEDPSILEDPSIIVDPLWNII
jgi:hypothetical protein